MFSAFSPRLTATVITALGAGAIGLAVATSGTASAGTADEAFIAQMKAVGVTFSSPTSAARQGHQVCQELASGKSGTDVAEEILSQTNLTTKQAAYFVVDATKAYCPQYATQLT
ncbi:hypothetical protein MB901379_03626 [Mycobacterium basiliense]|uniref:DUF732 domain-containing protein n=1 Tax=Mycobacterium basiliense TaxID=2094119 RepID=A0A447GHU4_9MYCO|nr:DUF732 domain-containing protein [Mycobacterium basiliense]VDM90033.1 hypothetical protein MB901379_03626 [Mycobacterium basiliense]